MFFKDLTRVEQLEERERLRDRLAALGEMAAAIAHEVKNPLAGIEVMAGLLRRKIPDCAGRAGDADRHHQRSQDGQRHRARKCSTSCGRSGSRWSTRPLRERVQGAMHLADTKARARRRRRRASSVAGGLPQIQADQHQLTQLFTNLLINAYRGDGRQRTRVDHAAPAAAPRGRRRADATRCSWNSRDDGPGMPADVADRIFNPFFTTKAQGSGLGLAIVRKIIDAHDGRIDLADRARAGHARFE